MGAETKAEHRVPGAASISEGEQRVVEVGGEEVGIFRVKGKLHAYLNRCPHQGGPVCTGLLVGRTELELAADKTVIREVRSTDDQHLACPWHGWEFNVETGVCFAAPKFRLRDVQVTTDGDDLVLSL